MASLAPALDRTRPRRSSSSPDDIIDVQSRPGANANDARAPGKPASAKRARPLGDLTDRRAKRTTRTRHLGEMPEAIEDLDEMDVSEESSSSEIPVEELSARLDAQLGLLYSHEIHLTHLKNEVRLIRLLLCSAQPPLTPSLPVRSP